MKTKQYRLASILLAAFLVGLSAPAFAVDGITLIKQTATTVFPIVISAPGSYRLASDLTVTSTTVDAIDINVNNVTLDLNGFSIIGPGSGSGNGIGGTTSNNVTVTNGTVTAMGSQGIELGLTSHVHIEGVRAVANVVGGVSVGTFARIVGNVFNGSTVEDGLDCCGECLISGNTANDNARDGILSRGGSAVIGNSASGNGGFGLNLSFDGYGKNVTEKNAAGCVGSGDGFETSMGDNICNGVKQ